MHISTSADEFTSCDYIVQVTVVCANHVVGIVVLVLAIASIVGGIAMIRSVLKLKRHKVKQIGE